MKMLTFSIAILAVINAVSSLSNASSEAYELKTAEILTKTETYYETAPKTVLEDARLTVPDIVRKYGYPSEIHHVESKDGYIIELHRIPHGSKGAGKRRGVALLHHGLLSSAADWIISGPGKGLAYMLADDDYDVWMVNARGSTYSRKHKTLHPDRDAEEFWDFSWHEIGVSDTPSIIDYVIAQTKEPKIFYIGHSQGTTIFYVMASERPEYNKKIKAMFSLAPTAYMKRVTSPLMRFGALMSPAVSLISKWLGLHEFLPRTELITKFGETICGKNSIFQPLCTNSLFVLCGFNKKQTNTTLLPVIMGHTPAGAATKQILHYAQEINSGKFRPYDYGKKKNKKIYGRKSPPDYNIKNIKVPMYIHYSRNDWLSNHKDAIKFYSKLPNPKGKFLTPDQKFNHADFVYGIDAYKILYNRIISLMRRH